MRVELKILGAALSAVLTAAGAHAATYDAVTGFSSTNPSGPWSYWTSGSTDVATYPGTITLAPVYIADCGFGTQCWDRSSGIDDLVLSNTTGFDVTEFANSDARNNQLTFFTRTGLTLVRFVAPAAGTYSVTGFFEGSAVTPESTTEFIDVNDSVASPTLSISGAEAYGAVNPFSFSATLAAGGSIDFLVDGVSTTPDLNSLATGFDATITSGAVPEPATWAMLILGMGFTGAVLRRRGALAA